MGREVRRVPAGWEHPKDGCYPDGSARYVPLLGSSFSQRHREWVEEKEMWEKGLQLGYNYPERDFIPKSNAALKCASLEEWSGGEPKEEHYMPEFLPSETTHYQMYETCTEGTPISPVMSSPEKLTRWLAENGASAFGDMTTSYDDWLHMIQGNGYAPSAVITVNEDGDGSLMSGVKALP